jgi:GNAT superfamily N-acetyltransferase
MPATNSLLLHTLCVDEGFRKHGHGKTLIQELIEDARHLDASTRVYLEVNLPHPHACDEVRREFDHRVPRLCATYASIGFVKDVTQPLSDRLRFSYRP